MFAGSLQFQDENARDLCYKSSAMKKQFLILLSVAGFALATAPAHAGHHTHVSVGFFASPFYGPAYYGPVHPYYCPPVYRPYYDGYYVESYRPVYKGIPVEAARTSDQLTERVQLALARKGFYNGEIDGLNGPGTRAAIRAFQAERGLPVSGVVDGALVRALDLR